MTSKKSKGALRRLAASAALIALACASGGSGGEAASPDEVDCSSLSACDAEQQCGGGAQCFKIKRCPGFVCADVQVACKLECGAQSCMVLESYPMMIGCR